VIGSCFEHPPKPLFYTEILALVKPWPRKFSASLPR
jgi:hypothetical protein